MGPLRRKGFLAAVAMCTLLAIYFGLVAARAVVLMQTGQPVAVALGAAFFVLPVIGVWWLVQEWRLAMTVGAMADELERDGLLPEVEREELTGRLSEESAARVFAEAKARVDADPNDWAAWYNVSFAYDAARDKRQARSTLRHAADLFRQQRRTR